MARVHSCPLSSVRAHAKFPTANVCHFLHLPFLPPILHPSQRTYPLAMGSPPSVPRADTCLRNSSESLILLEYRWVPEPWHYLESEPSWVAWQPRSASGPGERREALQRLSPQRGRGIKQRSPERMEAAARGTRDSVPAPIVSASTAFSWAPDAIWQISLYSSRVRFSFLPPSHPWLRHLSTQLQDHPTAHFLILFFLRNLFARFYWYSHTARTQSLIFHLNTCCLASSQRGQAATPWLNHTTGEPGRASMYTNLSQSCFSYLPAGVSWHNLRLERFVEYPEVGSTHAPGAGGAFGHWDRVVCRKRGQGQNVFKWAFFNSNHKPLRTSAMRLTVSVATNKLWTLQLWISQNSSG